MSNDKVQGMITELKEDNTSGANELIDKVLDIFKNQAELISNETRDLTNVFMRLAEEIMNSRPSMAPLINTVGSLIENLEIITKRDILLRIKQFNQHKSRIEKSLEKNFIEFILQHSDNIYNIMLISYSSTIIRLMSHLINKDSNFELFIMESRPLFEGRRTAEILSTDFKIHLITDAAIGKFMNQMDLVLVGIDSILKDGSIINKIGTFPLAVLANEMGIDVYAIGESLKYNLRSHFGLRVEIEEKPSEEVFKTQSTKEHLIVHNYYFDITPPQYITGIISDLGVLKPIAFVRKAKKVLPINWFQKFLNDNDQFIK